MANFSSARRTVHTERIGQVSIYLGKFFRIFMNENGWKVFPTAMIVSILVASVCVNVFYSMEATQIAALAMACVCIWNGFFNSIQVVVKERPIIKREHRAGLHISSYVVAQMIYQAFLCLGQTLIQIIVYKAFIDFGFWSYPFPISGPVTGIFIVDFGITLFLITFAADMVALMVSCIVKSTTTAMTVVPFLLIIQLIFSGVAFTLNGFMENISWLMISRWGIRSLCTVSNYNSLPSMTLRAAVNQLTKVEEMQEMIQQLNMIDKTIWPNFMAEIDARSTLQMINEKFAYTAQNVLSEWAILIGFSVLFAIIAIIALEFIDKDKR